MSKYVAFEAMKVTIPNSLVKKIYEDHVDTNEVHEGMTEYNHSHVSLMLNIGDEE